MIARVNVAFALLVVAAAPGCTTEPTPATGETAPGEAREGQAAVDGGTVFYGFTPRRAPSAAPADGTSLRRPPVECPVALIGGGSGMDSRQWAETVSWLTASHDVLRIDPRGVGRSPLPTVPYSDAADLSTVLDRLEIPRAVVVGNSSGAAVALEAAIRYPERVIAVVAVAPFVPGFEMSEAMAARVARFGAAADAGAETFVGMLLDDPHFLPAPDHPEARTLARRLIAENFAQMAAADVTLPIPMDPPLIHHLDRIRAPLLVLIGDLDHPDLHRRVAFVQQVVYQAEIVTVERAGHTLHLEQPLVFGRTLQAFLDEVCGAPVS